MIDQDSVVAFGLFGQPQIKLLCTFLILFIY